MSEAAQQAEETKVKKQPKVLVFDSLDAAKANQPAADGDGENRFRLYTVPNHDGSETAYVWERNPVTAVGRAFMHFGAEYQVTEPKERSFPKKLTAENASDIVSGLDEETRKALIASLKATRPQ